MDQFRLHHGLKPAPQQMEGPQDRRHLILYPHQEPMALEVGWIKEVGNPLPLTPLPMPQDYILGICGHRGIIMPVVDLARRLEVGVLDVSQPHRLVVLSRPDHGLVALAVARLGAVISLDPAQVSPVNDERRPWIRGLVGESTEPIIVLNPAWVARGPGDAPI